jgi:hypothetical protein
MQASADEIKALWVQRFGSSVPNAYKTKAAVVEAYLIGKPRPAPSTRTTAPRARQTQLRNAEWTVIKGPKYKPDPNRPLPSPTNIVCSIQRALAAQGKLNTRDEPQLLLLGGRWSSNTVSASSNFVLIFAGQPDASLVVAHEKILTAPFGIGAELVPKAGFSCIRVFGVPILANAYEPDDLKTEIMRNPDCKGLTFIHPPRWFFKDHGGRSHDSILLTIYDPANKFTPPLIRRPLWLFGMQCRARRFDSRPVLRQCEKCHKLGHSLERCTRRDPLFVRCTQCGGGHAAENHEVRCPNRAIHKTTGACDCPPICGNCKDAKKQPFKGHTSFDPSCPLRKLYRDPDFRSEYPQDQDPFFRTEEPPFDADAVPEGYVPHAQTLITEHVAAAPPQPAVPTARIDEVMADA